ncbi:hypothetical protein A3A21_02540 [Candidatus Jorgensenbacteria bacterium RIFCSPLOWO2_01_FULL_45_25b]|uniref:GxxExxY protein n=1 Tax=Candidatus Jorgensenbacteria bacterium RIFCSPLOWO2_01_FULL_45_25b TaxID=1798471 RepID=A0A1F6BTE4_9BACT|nr:MAG: hypothetical protein A3A21_02540 [Candidatus Jorgensenbacteria bacterium RIFCSPLOWO2_01_FULL_45_25b]
MQTALIHTPSTVRNDILHKELSYVLGGIFYRAHDKLGRYAREKQYGDLLESLFLERNISYTREKTLTRTGTDVNQADFVVENLILIELKAKPLLLKGDYYQVLRYLECANLQLGLLVNFRQYYLKPKRIINPKFIF